MSTHDDTELGIPDPQEIADAYLAAFARQDGESAAESRVRFYRGLFEALSHAGGEALRAMGMGPGQTHILLPRYLVTKSMMPWPGSDALETMQQLMALHALIPEQHRETARLYGAGEEGAASIDWQETVDDLAYALRLRTVMHTRNRFAERAGYQGTVEGALRALPGIVDRARQQGVCIDEVEQALIKAQHVLQAWRRAKVAASAANDSANGAQG